MMEYMKQKHKSCSFLDPTYPVIDRTTFIDGAEWKEFYGDTTKEIPPDALDPRGKEFDIQMMVGSYHAWDKATRCSRTGFLIYVNMTLINWLSKKQLTIESSLFGAEFLAMKNGMEVLCGIR